MSTLKALLKDVPVEWKALIDIAIIGTGSHDTKDAVDNGNYVFYARGIKPLSLNTYDFDETAIITAGDGVGVGKVFHWVEGKYALHQRAYRIVPNKLTLPRYIYHYFVSNFYDYISKQSVFSSVSSLRKPMFEKFQIPIPYPNDPEKSLAIQQEIVRVLDILSEQNKALTTALAQEIDQRKKQYAYYREELFRFEGKEVEWKTLGEVGSIKRGVAFTKKEAILGRYPVVANAVEPICNHNEYNRDGEFIVVSRSGANAGMISYWNGKIYLTDAFSIHPDSKYLNTKFAFYFLKKFQNEIHLMKRGSGVPHVRASDFEIYNFPVPSLQEQERIVRLLDKFDEATKNIVAQLEKEIELRNKQYEYYRNLLLSFDCLN